MEEFDFSPVVDEGIAIADSDGETSTSQTSEEQTDGIKEEGIAIAQSEGNTEELSGTEAETTAQTDEPFLSFNHNHEERRFTREQAIDELQKGYKNESRINRLDYIAAQSGKSIDEVIDNLVSAMDSQYRESLVEKFGEDPETIEPLMELYHNKQKETYDKVLSDRRQAEEEAQKNTEKSTNERLAEQLSEVQAMFPEVKSFNDIPESVRNKAIKNGTDLTKEYLIYARNEQQKAQKAEETQNAAKEKTTGSLASENEEQNSFENSFLGGLWGR